MCAASALRVRFPPNAAKQRRYPAAGCPERTIARHDVIDAGVSMRPKCGRPRGAMMVSIYQCDDVTAVRSLHAGLLTDDALREPIADQLRKQADRLLDGHRSGHRGAVPSIACWHPDRIGWAADGIFGASLELGDARLTIAREYGFDDWSAVETLAAMRPDPEFWAAVDATLCGEEDTLRSLLRCSPGLSGRRSEFGHGAGLLHYAAANGVETWRQVVPSNLPTIVRVLLAAGCDPNAGAAMYGGATPLALLASSAHPAAAGVAEDAVAVLIAGGAIAGV